MDDNKSWWDKPLKLPHWFHRWRRFSRFHMVKMPNRRERPMRVHFRECKVCGELQRRQLSTPLGKKPSWKKTTIKKGEVIQTKQIGLSRQTDFPSYRTIRE